MTGPGSSFARGIVPLRNVAVPCLLLLALAACAPVAVSVKPDSGLTRTKTLRVFAEHGDPLGVKAKLETLLAAKGFRLLTTQEGTSDYVLRFRYVYLDGFRGFFATIADTSSDKVVAVGQLQGYRLDDEFLDEFIAKLAEQVP
jgi:hypothetical protein